MDVLLFCILLQQTSKNQYEFAVLQVLTDHLSREEDRSIGESFMSQDFPHC